MDTYKDTDEEIARVQGGRAKMAQRSYFFLTYVCVCVCVNLCQWWLLKGDRERERGRERSNKEKLKKKKGIEETKRKRPAW